MKVLHTSDWHIGRTLYGQKRYEEFQAFLNWLATTIKEQQVDVLLVAGDVFDTTTPSNRAQGLYYRFLREAILSCRHVVVTGGNHDSSSFLNAPKELLRELNVHAAGAATSNPKDEVLILRDLYGSAELIVCAVPFLRDRDIRVAEAGESIKDKEKKLIEGICKHYTEVAQAAEEERMREGEEIPIIAMGHLFTTGGKTVEGDGVRELYIGSLGHVSAGIFPDCIDYLALGHLHLPQKVNNSERMRYSGSPLPMGFGEANHRKSVCLLEFFGRSPSVRLIDVPVFQKLECVRGTWEEISARISELSVAGYRAWLDVIYEGDEIRTDLRENLESMVYGSKMEILRVKNNRIAERMLNEIDDNQTLEDLDVNELFDHCLQVHDIPKEQRPELIRSYGKAVSSIHEEDIRAE